MSSVRPVVVGMGAECLGSLRETLPPADSRRMTSEESLSERSARAAMSPYPGECPGARIGAAHHCGAIRSLRPARPALRGGQPRRRSGFPPTIHLVWDGWVATGMFSGDKSLAREKPGE